MLAGVPNSAFLFTINIKSIWVKTQLVSTVSEINVEKNVTV